MSKTQREAERKIYSEWQCTQCSFTFQTYRSTPDSTPVGETAASLCARCKVEGPHLKTREWIE